MIENKPSTNIITNNYTQNHEFQRQPLNNLKNANNENAHLQQQLLNYILENSKKDSPDDVIQKIDKFCYDNWMMNVGPEKGNIALIKGFKKQTCKVIQLGGYCGYSALIFGNYIKNNQNSIVYSFQINQQFAKIASKIHQHAGISEHIQVKNQTLLSNLAFIKQKGPFDVIFLDHEKQQYLKDLKLIQQNGGVVKGTVVIADNIIYPGSPQYLQYFKQNTQYQSVLYHSYDAYSNVKDAIMISIKL